MTTSLHHSPPDGALGTKAQVFVGVSRCSWGFTMSRQHDDCATTPSEIRQGEVPKILTSVDTRFGRDLRGDITRVVDLILPAPGMRGDFLPLSKARSGKECIQCQRSAVCSHQLVWQHRRGTWTASRHESPASHSVDEKEALPDLG